MHASPGVSLAQPFNAIFGNTISALIGVFVRKYIGGAHPVQLWMQPVQCALAVSFSIVMMLVTGYEISLVRCEASNFFDDRYILSSTIVLVAPYFVAFPPLHA